MGARDVPVLVWLFVAISGLVYIVLFCIGHLLASTGTSSHAFSDWEAGEVHFRHSEDPGEQAVAR